jgi:hypothetical protein
VRVLPSTPDDLPWRPLVTSALLFTLTAGALSGAIDLWTLRVLQVPVPVDHQRGHAFTQLFGFVWLFIAAVSLRLAPRFFNAPLHGAVFSRWFARAAITGVLLLIIGRLGRLVPLSAELGLVGATLLVVAMSAWVRFVVGLAFEVTGALDALQRFALAGAGWWWLSSVLLLAWQLGQTLGGVTANVPLETVQVLALYGGAASWLFGLFLRPGVATLHLEPPAESRRLAAFALWQLAVVVAAFASWTPGGLLEQPSRLLLAIAALGWWLTVKPLSGPPPLEGPLQPRALQAGAIFLLVFIALETWWAVGTAPALVADAARHVFTLGTVTLMLLGFAGRMLPSFAGVPLRWPAAYDAGVMAVAAGAALRLAELLPVRAGLALAGASGALAFAGLSLVAAALLATLWGRPAAS